MGKMFAVMSGKGGVGKSTLSAALAVYYARSGLNTILLDGDVGLRCADLMLDVQDKVVYDLGDLVEKRCAAEQALVSPAGLPQLSLVAAPQLMKASEMKSREVAQWITRLGARADVLLIDAPAGIGRGLKNLLGTAAAPVIVATPDDVSVRDAERLAQLLSERGETRPALVLNRVNERLIRSGEMRPPQALAQALDLPLAGVAPESPAVYRALLAHCTALDCGDRAVQDAVERIAGRLLGADVPLPEYAPSPVWRFFHRR